MKAAEKAYAAARGGIIEGRYPPGSRITEQEIAATAGVSRTPVREALQRLQAEGLVRFAPHQGAFVTDWSHADAEDIFELRAMLEAFAAERAAANANDEQLQRLRELAERQYAEAQTRSPGFLERIADLNSRFHQLLQDAADSKRLSILLATLTEAPLVLQTFRDYSTEDLLRSSQHHLDIVDALGARDGSWAATIMRTHVLAARRNYRRHQRRRSDETSDAA